MMERLKFEIFTAVKLVGAHETGSDKSLEIFAWGNFMTEMSCDLLSKWSYHGAAL